MQSAPSIFVGAQPPAAREAPFNWGLLVAIGLCLAFWALAVLGLVLIV